MATPDITTYAGLTTAIEQYIQVEYAGDSAEPTLVSNIPNFIQNAERLINNSVQLPAFRKNVTGSCSTSNPYLTLPNDFLATFSVAVMDAGATQLEGYKYLLNKDVNYIREAFPFPGVSGTPQYYAIFDANTYILGPTPDHAYDIELHYFAYPESIVTAGSTWVSTNYPNTLLWGALVEAYIFAKGEAELLQAYQSKYEEAMGPLKMLGDARDKTDGYRAPQARYQVQ